jgi:hypothetical protein
MLCRTNIDALGFVRLCAAFVLSFDVCCLVVSLRELCASFAQALRSFVQLCAALR